MRIPPLRITRIVPVIVGGVACLLTVLCVQAETDAREDHAELTRLLEEHATTRKPAWSPDEKADGGKKKPPTSKPQPTRADEQVKTLATRFVFRPKPPAKRWPTLTGILGDKAYFGAQGVAVGGSHGGAKVLELGGDWVEMEMDGKTRRIGVFTGGAAPPPMPSPGGGRPAGPSRGRMVAAPTPMPQPARAPRAGTMVLTPQMIEEYKKLPPEVRAKALQSVPPEIQEQLKNL